jgi:hypothetical protein
MITDVYRIATEVVHDIPEPVSDPARICTAITVEPQDHPPRAAGSVADNIVINKLADAVSRSESENGIAMVSVSGSDSVQKGVVVDDIGCSKNSRDHIGNVVVLYLGPARIECVKRVLGAVGAVDYIVVRH